MQYGQRRSEEILHRIVALARRGQNWTVARVNHFLVSGTVQKAKVWFVDYIAKARRGGNELYVLIAIFGILLVWFALSISSGSGGRAEEAATDNASSNGTNYYTVVFGCRDRKMRGLDESYGMQLANIYADGGRLDIVIAKNEYCQMLWQEVTASSMEGKRILYEVRKLNGSKIMVVKQADDITLALEAQ